MQIQHTEKKGERCTRCEGERVVMRETESIDVNDTIDIRILFFLNLEMASRFRMAILERNCLQ
jgi:hypothetical protein